MIRAPRNRKGLQTPPLGCALFYWYWTKGLYAYRFCIYLVDSAYCKRLKKGYTSLHLFQQKQTTTICPTILTI